MKKTLNPIALLICLILMVIFSCEKDNLLKNTCGVKNPTKDLVWMKNDIAFIEQLSPDESQYITITAAKYNGKSVFFSIYCDPAVEAVFPVRNCAGETIEYWGEIVQEDLKDQQVIWRSANCVCIN